MCDCVGCEGCAILSCVSGCVVGHLKVVVYVVCVLYGLCGVSVGLYAACMIC